jgi:small subunit ribosomal protein S13
MQKKTINKIKSIKGVGLSTISNMRLLLGANSRKISEFNVSYNGVVRIKKILRLQKTTSLLEAIITKRVNNHITIKSYKGLRHKNGYPVRGQRTRTNSKTQRKLTRY